MYHLKFFFSSRRRHTRYTRIVLVGPSRLELETRSCSDSRSTCLSYGPTDSLLIWNIVETVFRVWRFVHRVQTRMGVSRLLPTRDKPFCPFTPEHACKQIPSFTQ